MKRGSHRVRLVLRTLIVLSLAAALVGGLTSVQAQGVAGQGSQAGQAAFEAKCIACHSIGEGDRVGPDLEGVSARRDRQWLLNWIMHPDQVLASGDATARELVARYTVPMPNLGVSQAEAEAILAYIDARSSASQAAPAPAVAQPPLVGDPVIGEQYFTGTRSFANGGPPCMACHSFAGLGALGGGALGPDLTGAYGKFGESGLASILASIPYPTMNPIFSSRPLTAEEQAHLVAFLKTALPERSSEAVGQLVTLAGLAAALLLGLAELLWARRLPAVRRPMVAGQRPRWARR